ncbi:MAG: InlB B-repeat-containing protein [Firmicutes bacterium]|nr:InlB B-repeat-containing protein [Bacillota bacterium]
MNKFRKLIAILLTVALVATTLTFTAGNSLLANEEEGGGSSAPAPKVEQTTPAPAPTQTEKQNITIESEDSNGSSEGTEGGESPVGEDVANTGEVANDPAPEQDEEVKVTFSSEFGNIEVISPNDKAGKYENNDSIKVKKGDKVSFKVVDEARGKRVDTVRADGNTLSPNGVVYEFTASSNATVAVTFVNEGEGGDGTEGEGSEEGEDPEPGTGTVDPAKYYSIAVNYIDEGGARLRNSYYDDVREGTEKTVAIPAIAGYTATIDGKTVSESYTVRIENDTTINVVYKAKTVNYTVIHDFPEGKDDVTEELSGKVGTYTDANAKKEVGYEPKGFSQMLIDADGATVTIPYKAIRYTVNFDSQGGSFIDSQAGSIGDTLAVEAPTKTGYNFLGWKTKADGSGTAIDSDITVNANQILEGIFKDGNTVTLYAQWEAKTVNYTINYWKQKVTDAVNASDAQKTYDYATSETKTALAGSTVSGSNTQSYKGFDYNDKKTDANIEVAPDGTTVVNVYYDRKVCTVNFYLYQSSGWWDGSWVVDSSHKGLYGAPFTEWRTDHYWHSSYNGSSGSGSGCILLTSYDFTTAGYANNKDNQKASDGTVITCNFYGSGTTGNSHVHYYNEQWDGSFKEVSDVKTSGGTLTIHEKYEGYDLYKYTTGSTSEDLTKASTWRDKSNVSDGKQTSRYPVYIASTLKTHTLSYFNYNSVDATKTVKYTTPLNKVEGYNYTPNRPAGLAKYYEFQGWYADKACSVPFDFEKTTMPNNNVQVYAKWAPQSFDVTFDYNYGDASDKGDQPANVVVKDVVGGQTIASDKIPATPANRATAEGSYKFLGWFVDGNQNRPFNAGMTVEANYTVKALWELSQEVEYTVTTKAIVDGQEITIGNPVIKEAYIGDKITEKAPTLTGDYANYIPDKLYKEVTLSADPSKNEVVFIYTTPHKEYYKVVYKDPNGNVIGAGPSGNNDPSDEGKYKDTMTVPLDNPPEGYDVPPSVVVDFTKGDTPNSNNPLVVTVTCTPKITIDLNDVTKVYDGKKHTAAEAKPPVVTAPAGYSVDVVFGQDGRKNVGTTSVTPVVTVTRNDETVESQISYVDGKSVANVKITPAPLTVTTASAVKYWDGYPLTKADGATATGFAEGEGATVTGDGTITEVGTAENTAKVEWNDNTIPGNYNITYNLGTLEVKNFDMPITVNVGSYNGVYDGAEHGVTVTVEGLEGIEGLEGFTAEASSNAKGTHVADSKEATCDSLVIKNAAGLDVTSHFTNITRNNGSITITPATLTVTTDSASELYTGEALTAPGEVTGYIDNETATFTVTGSQIEVGSSTNTYTLTFDKSAAESDYTVSESLGTLTITEKEDAIVATPKTVTVPYDGDAHGVEVEVTGLPEGYRAEATSNAEATHVAQGTVPANVDTFKIIRVSDGKDVTKAFKNITKNTGSITITPVELTVTTQSASKTYDGEALTAEGSIEGFVNNETATFAVTGSQTAVGSSSNTYTLKFDKTAEATDYTVNPTVGTLTVTEYAGEITVTTTGGEKTYDGTALTATVSVSTLPTGYRVEKAESTATATHVAEGTVPATADVLVIKNAADEDVTAKLNIHKVNDTIKINPATLTVTTPSDSKVYDGTPLTKEGTITGFVTVDEVTETATFNTIGSQTAVGSSDNTYEIVWNGTAVETDYTVNESVGTLTVTEYADQIVVTTTGETATYDGLPHGATVEVTGLPNGYTVETATSSATLTDAGTKTADCDTLVIKNAQGKDVTAKLNVNKIPGTITVNKKDVTVVTGGATKVYDGKALTNNDVTVTGIVDGETFGKVATGKQTEVGTSKNTYKLIFGDILHEGENYTAKASNYNVELSLVDGYTVPAAKETLGDLTVTEYAGEITVTTTGGTFTYDGQAHGATVEVSTLPAGYTLEKAASTATATHVAQGAVPATADVLVIKNAKGEDVTSRLTGITYVDGTIKINPATLTVVTPDADKVYDGKALTAEGSIEGFVANETATFATTGSQTAVGSSNNTYSLVFDGTAVESDYTVDETVGTLTVTQSTDEIVITTKGGEFTYDGLDYKGTVTVGTLPEGYTVEVAESTTTVKNVAEGEKNVTADHVVIRNAEGEDVTEDLNIKYVDDTIKVTPATLTVVTPDANKTYDGTALTAEGSIEGFVANETATFKTTGTQTAVGSSDNTYSLVFDGTAAESNYTVDETVGTLTVSESTEEITVTTTGGTKTYDGTPQGATVEVSTLPAGYTLEKAASTATATHVAQGTVTATADQLIIRNAEGEDVTAKLNIKKVDGSIKINPATLTVETPDASKVYDGTPLTKEGSIEGFVNNETATFKTTGSQTDVGTSDNTYTLVFDKTAAESDYTVEGSVGALTVTQSKDEIVVTTTGGEFTYDGTAHGATVTVGKLPTGYTLEKAESTATATHVAEGTVPATADVLVIKNAKGEDVTSDLNIRYVDGGIKINPATLTVVTPDANKTYDGKALTAEGTITGFIGEETATFETTGSQTVVGSSDNTYSLKFDGTAAESDYTVDETVGTLTVSEYAGEITVTTTGGTKTYDGTPQGATVEVSALPAGYTLEKAESTATAIHVAEGTVTATADVLVIKNADGEDVTAKLNIKKVDGSIKINPATLTVVTPTESKVYDGKALTAEGTIEGFIGDEEATFETTGSQTKVGTSDNTYSLVFDKTAKATDYTVAETIGKLTVTQSKDEIVVTTTGGEFTYDGDDHKGTVTVGTVPEGYTVEVAETTTTVKAVDDGEKTVTADKLIIRNAEGEDVTEELNIKYVDDTIKVTPATLTVVTPDASKTYDGTALTAEGTIEGFVKEETADFATTGSQTNVGNSKNTYEITWDGTAKESNYTVEETVGTLTVTPKSIVPGIDPGDEPPVDPPVNPANGTNGAQCDSPSNYVYDGNTHQWNPTLSDKETGKTIPTSEYTVKYNTTDFTNTGEIRVTITADPNGNYTGSFIKTYKITPAPLKVETYSATKVYDTKPLTAGGEIIGIVDGETVEFKTTGSQTEEGSCQNTYELKWGTAKESNYQKPVEELGTLTVTPKSIVPVDPDDPSDKGITVNKPSDVTYDGDAHKWIPVVKDTETGKTLVEGEDYTVTYPTDDFTNVTGEIIVEINGKGNYKDSFTESYQITPAPLKVKTEGATKVYDKNPLTNENATISGLVKNETATIKGIGSRTTVGHTENNYEITWGTAKETNYKIVEEVLGLLVVIETQEEIVVTTTGGKFVYDGKTHRATVEVTFGKEVAASDSEVALTGHELPEGYRVETAESNDSATHVSEGVVKADCDKLVIVNGENEDVTSKLKIRYVNDTIEILPTPLTVKTESATRRANKKPLTAGGSVTGYVGDETATFTVTGSRTKIGKSLNTYTLVFDQTAAETDYSIVEELGILRVTAPAPGPGPGPGPGSNPPVDPDDPTDPDVNVQRIVDNNTPIGNEILDEYCCILHLIIMLIAMILLIAYTYDMKKRQKRIFELQEEIDEITNGEGLE